MRRVEMGAADENDVERRGAVRHWVPGRQASGPGAVLFAVRSAAAVVAPACASRGRRGVVALVALPASHRGTGWPCTAQPELTATSGPDGPHSGHGRHCRRCPQAPAGARSSPHAVHAVDAPCPGRHLLRRACARRRRLAVLLNLRNPVGVGAERAQGPDTLLFLELATAAAATDGGSGAQAHDTNMAPAHPSQTRRHRVNG